MFYSFLSKLVLKAGYSFDYKQKLKTATVRVKNAKL